MREYETVICVRTDLDEAEQESQVRALTDLITEKGGEVVLVDPWGRRRLAYEVNKHNEGIYTLVRYVGNNEILDELERRFRINEHLLRHLTVVADGPRPEPEAAETEPAAAETASTEPAATATEPAAAGAVETAEGATEGATEAQPADKAE